MDDGAEAECIASYRRIIADLDRKEVVLKGPQPVRTEGGETDLVAVESALNSVKAKTGALKHRRRWRSHTEWTHPLGKEACPVESPPSRAYLKFLSILRRNPQLLKAERDTLRSLHLCESPGNFVAALGDVLEHSWQWRMNSLNPHFEWNEPGFMLTEDALVLGAPEHMLFGANGSGDVFRLTKTDLQKCGRVDLVTADGSFDCTEDPGGQEDAVASLIDREVSLACAVLETGGSLVLKMFTFFKPESHAILCRLVGSFERVILCKPEASKPSNSEVYVVCIGFLGEVKVDESSETLKRIAVAAAYFSSKQREMIEFNLESFALSVFARCQMEEIKSAFVLEWMEAVLPSEAGSFWRSNAAKLPFFPVRLTRFAVDDVAPDAPPFPDFDWWRQTRVVAIPKNELPPNRAVTNPLLAFPNTSGVDFCELVGKVNLDSDFEPIWNDPGVVVLAPWTLSKSDLLEQLLSSLQNANRIMVRPVAGENCVILSRFAISVMAILMDSFEIDGIPPPRSAILLKRKKATGDAIVRFLKNVQHEQLLNEVLAIVPLADLSEPFRTFIRYYNGWNEAFVR